MFTHGRILLLDQPAKIENLFSEGLIVKNSGIEFMVSTNQNEAIAELKRAPIDMCLCGLQLQDQTIEPFIHWMKESSFRDVPALLMAPEDQQSLVNQCLSKGAKDVIWQPFQMEDLKKSILHIFDEHVRPKTRIESFLE